MLLLAFYNLECYIKDVHGPNEPDRTGIFRKCQYTVEKEGLKIKANRFVLLLHKKEVMKN